jgi:hypothetical protein
VQDNSILQIFVSLFHKPSLRLFEHILLALLHHGVPKFLILLPPLLIDDDFRLFFFPGGFGIFRLRLYFGYPVKIPGSDLQEGVGGNVHVAVIAGQLIADDWQGNVGKGVTQVPNDLVFFVPGPVAVVVVWEIRVIINIIILGEEEFNREN